MNWIRVLIVGGVEHCILMSVAGGSPGAPQTSNYDVCATRHLL
jgi:hypothetical protein